MDFIQTANKQADKFGAGKHGFSAGNPVGGVAATFVSPDFFDDVMMEIINVVEGGGLAATAATRNQMKLAIDILIRKRAGAFCAAGGTADAITGAFTPAVTADSDGLTVSVRAAGANTSTTPTFKADGTAVVTIVKENNQPLLPGDIPGAGHWMVLVYDATLTRWVLANPAAKLGTGYLSVRDEKASATAGGNAVVGAQTRTLNTVVANTIPGASLSANQITLPAGTYRVRASAPAAVNHRVYLFNVTDGVNQILGTSENNTDTSNVDPVWTCSSLEGRFTIAATKVFELRDFCAQAKTGGLGAPFTNDGQVEIYSLCEITRE
jgi:hypothetical protein